MDIEAAPKSGMQAKMENFILQKLRDEIKMLKDRNWDQKTKEETASKTAETYK